MVNRFRKVMHVKHELEKDIHIFLLDGVLTHETVKQAKNFISPYVDDDTQDGILLNFENVSFMDSTGIGMLIAFFRMTQQQDRKFALCDFNKTLTSMIKTAKLDTILTVYTTQEESILQMT